MACGRNREYKPVNTWKRVDYTQLNQRNNRNDCTCSDGYGFEWLAAMQAAAQNECNAEEAYVPVNGWGRREKYLMELVGYLLAMMHRHHHE